LSQRRTCWRVAHCGNLLGCNQWGRPVSGHGGHARLPDSCPPLTPRVAEKSKVRAATTHARSITTYQDDLKSTSSSNTRTLAMHKPCAIDLSLFYTWSAFTDRCDRSIQVRTIVQKLRRQPDNELAQKLPSRNPGAYVPSAEIVAADTAHPCRDNVTHRRWRRVLVSTWIETLPNCIGHKSSLRDTNGRAAESDSMRWRNHPWRGAGHHLWRVGGTVEWVYPGWHHVRCRSRSRWRNG
jgi:hypothetical protein